MIETTFFCESCRVSVDVNEPSVCLGCLHDAQDRIEELELALKTLMHEVSNNPLWTRARFDPDQLCTLSEGDLRGLGQSALESTLEAQQAWRMAVKAVRRLY